jgi:hypothetical protein
MTSQGRALVATGEPAGRQTLNLPNKANLRTNPNPGHGVDPRLTRKTFCKTKPIDTLHLRPVARRWSAEQSHFADLRNEAKSRPWRGIPPHAEDVFAKQTQSILSLSAPWGRRGAGRGGERSGIPTSPCPLRPQGRRGSAEQSQIRAARHAAAKRSQRYARRQARSSPARNGRTAPAPVPTSAGTRQPSRARVIRSVFAGRP